jgi:uncharacterized C2H2 Zn-finger protein
MDGDRQQALTLMLTCPRCGTAFRYWINMDWRKFEDAYVLPKHERCPSCGHLGRFEKRDYFYDRPSL